MARHQSPRVEKHWPLLVQMQWLIQSGVTRHGAAVSVAKKDWRGVSKSYDACVWWLQDNYRKFRDELDPVAKFFAKQREDEERERLSKLTPAERYEQRKKEMKEKRASVTKYEKAKARAARLEATRQEEVKSARWQEWFKQDPKGAVYALIDELINELKAELKAELIDELELKSRPRYF
jgi:hypothetical protein